MLLIEKIKKDDYFDYIEMAKSFYNSEAVLHKVDEKNFDNTFNELIKRDIYAQGYILRYDNIVCGYVLISKTYSQEVGSLVLLIEELFIKKEYRGKGISKKVFEFLFNEYKEYGRIRLEVEKSNEKAISIYRKMGFSNLEYLQMIIDKK